MNRLINTSNVAVKLVLIAVLALQSLAINASEHSHHQDKHQGVLKVENAFATPTFALAKMGAGYFTLSNTRDKDVAITAVSVDKELARIVEMHETYFDGELAKMRQLKMPYIIKAGETVEFVPQGKHLMLIGLTGPLEKGNSFELTLTFASGEKQVIAIPVQEKQGAGHHHHH